MAADGTTLHPSSSIAIGLFLQGPSSSIEPEHSVSSPRMAASAPGKWTVGLDGDILLITTPRPPPAAWIERIEAKYPGLRVVYRDLQWGSSLAADAVSADIWKAATVLLTTGASLPKSRAEVPRLRYVQLVSAGANQIIKQPLFTDTDIVFATANGVHG